MSDIVELLKAGPVYDAWSDDGPTQTVMQQAAAEITHLRSLVGEAGKVMWDIDRWFGRWAGKTANQEAALEAARSLLTKLKEQNA